MTFNLVSPNKKLSQLIAQSWLDGQRLTIDKKFLVDNGLFSAEEAQYIEEIQVDENPSEPYLDRIIHDIGSDNLLFGADYPPMDHKPDIVEKAVALQEQLGQKTVQKILWDNPARFYGLERESL